jgi:hypothetical protein
LLAAGFLAVVVIELSFWQTATGDPLHRIHAANTLVERGLARFDANPAGWIPHPAAGEQYRSDNNFLDAALMFATNEEFGVLYWLVWPMVVVFGAARDGKTQYLRLWIVSLALLFLFFPVKWPAHTMPRDPRYYICLTVPATLVLASFLERRATLVRRTIIAAIVVSGLGCLYLGHEASKMSVQKELLAFQRAHSDQWLWVSPRTAADLIVLSEFTLGDRVGVHLMEQERDSDTFRAAVSMRPALTVAADPRALREGYAVISEGTWKRPARWCAETFIRPQPSALTSVIQIALRRVGVPNRFVAKLSPSGDRTLMIFRVGQECGQASLSN